MQPRHSRLVTLLSAVPPFSTPALMLFEVHSCVDVRSVRPQPPVHASMRARARERERERESESESERAREREREREFIRKDKDTP